MISSGYVSPGVWPGVIIGPLNCHHLCKNQMCDHNGTQLQLAVIPPTVRSLAVNKNYHSKQQLFHPHQLGQVPQSRGSKSFWGLSLNVEAGDLAKPKVDACMHGVWSQTNHVHSSQLPAMWRQLEDNIYVYVKKNQISLVLPQTSFQNEHLLAFGLQAKWCPQDNNVCKLTASYNNNNNNNNNSKTNIFIKTKYKYLCSTDLTLPTQGALSKQRPQENGLGWTRLLGIDRCVWSMQMKLSTAVANAKVPEPDQHVPPLPLSSTASEEINDGTSHAEKATGSKSIHSICRQLHCTRSAVSS